MESFLMLIFTIVLLFFLLGYIRTFTLKAKPQQKTFEAGTVPDPLPDGFYKGSVTGYKVTWQGKTFNKEKKSGINVIKNGDSTSSQFPFTTSVGKGMQDKNLDVLKIDYNLPKNSFFVRAILDELVEVEKNHFLGKVHFRLIPGFPFTLGFFELKKQ